MSAAPLGLAGRTFLSRITEKWCEDELLAQDQWLASLLNARPAWQLSGPHLRVSTGQAVIELTDRRVLDPDRSLEGTRWVLSALVGGNLMVADAAEPSRVFPPLSIGRAVAITDEGREALRKHLGLATGWRRGS